MGKVSKNYKAALAKIEDGKQYQLQEACNLVKTLVTTKFDSSVDIDIRLGVDPKKANQMVRGVVTLPNGTGKDKKVLVLCTPDKEEEAKAAGADYVGLDEYVDKIQKGWTDVDVIITMPSCMGKVGKLGRILGPRGLMPNPKTGTVTMEIAQAVKDVKLGKIDFKVDKFGIIRRQGIFRRTEALRERSRIFAYRYQIEAPGFQGYVCKERVHERNNVAQHRDRPQVY